MPYCPTCRTEYHEGVTHCADCGGTLRAGPVPETEASPLLDDSPKAEPVILCRLADGAEVQVVCAALREADIPFFLQTSGPISAALHLHHRRRRAGGLHHHSRQPAPAGPGRRGVDRPPHRAPRVAGRNGAGGVGLRSFKTP